MHAERECGERQQLAGIETQHAEQQRHHVEKAQRRPRSLDVVHDEGQQQDRRADHLGSQARIAAAQVQAAAKRGIEQHDQGNDDGGALDRDRHRQGVELHEDKQCGDDQQGSGGPDQVPADAQRLARVLLRGLDSACHS